MSDLFGMGLQHPLVRQEFLVRTNGGATNATMPRNTWVKPRGTNFTAFILIGAGSVGGNGFTRTAGSAGGGGGGGGSGAFARAIFLNEFLPDELDVFIPGASTGAGGRAYLALTGITAFAALNTYLCSGAADATAAGNGASGAVGALGAAGTIGTAAQSTLVNLALAAMWVAGSAGVAGGAQAGGAGVSKTIDNIVNGAPGGAGCTTTDFAGGAVTASSPFPGIIATSAAGQNGNGGYEFVLSDGGLGKIWVPGGGGHSNNSGVGGKGADGPTGCGGAGGGAGATGGAGGLGGPGFGIAVSW